LPSQIDIVEKLPYVQNVGLGHLCRGWVTNPNGKRGRCREVGILKFTASKSTGKGRAKSGYFCLYHLMNSCLRYSKYEMERAERAYTKATKES
jgi:hypothetical protein